MTATLQDVTFDVRKGRSGLYDVSALVNKSFLRQSLV